MNDIIIAVIGSGALSTLVSLIVTTFSRRKKIEDALQVLLLAEIERQGDRYSAKGEISMDAYQRFNDIYTVYKALGGNGYATRIKEAVDELPLTK